MWKLLNQKSWLLSFRNLFQNRNLVTKLRKATMPDSSYPAATLTDLDQNCLSLILSFTSAADVCRLAPVSKSFAEASLSDTVWKSFLPAGISDVLKENNSLGDTDSLIDGSLFDDSGTLKFRIAYRVLTKGLFINEGRQKVEIDKRSGDFVFHISVVENLCVIWGDHSRYWRMENGIPKATFAKVAHLIDVCWFQIGGRISCFLPMGKYICSWRLARDSSTTFTWHANKIDSKITRYREEDVTNTIEMTSPVTSDTISKCARGEWSEVVAGEVTIGREDVRVREDGREGEVGFLDMHLDLREVDDGNWKSGLYVDSFILRQVRI